MLSPQQKIAFVIFAMLALAAGAAAWTRLLRRVLRGRRDSDLRFNRPIRRVLYALSTTLSQRRTFRKRYIVSFFHSLIFYGFVFYLLVNLVDAAEGFVPFVISSQSLLGRVYNLSADAFSALVLLGVLALVARRFFLPSRRDFAFNERTMLHRAIVKGKIQLDSVIVSAFILFHVGSRAIGAGARIAEEGGDRFQPFATLISHAFNVYDAHIWRVLGYWGALGSVLLFLAYFPRSKHLHIFMAPLKYAVARDKASGVLPVADLQMDSDSAQPGARSLEDLSWPRLLDAYACIQCNRCQDVCPATATGKSLSPSALEINKRMELNELAASGSGFEKGGPSPRPLLDFALTVDAVWGCTTCGACLEVCPVQDEPMLDIIDIRRQQVMVESEFPSQLQSAFRGMERANNPWGINHEKRMDWCDGLDVPTTEAKPDPDVLFWVGCAASYDPQAQKTARAFVQLLHHAGVDFAVLGKRECCTGDTARRAGNEYLYRQLADQNVSTLNSLSPKLIVASCPHCMNAVGKEYAQIGGDYKVMHHTEFLESLVASGRLEVDTGGATVAFHDPCYLGRHHGGYDAPRSLLHVLSNDVVELDRSRENSFCCGAGGAQFWKEEEPGDERISDNRFREVESKLVGANEPVLAVGCPFCKSMLQSTPSNQGSTIAVKDIAELMLEGVQRRTTRMSPEAALVASLETAEHVAPEVEEKQSSEPRSPEVIADVMSVEPPVTEPIAVERKKWVPKKAEPQVVEVGGEGAGLSPVTERKKWSPKEPKLASPTELVMETENPHVADAVILPNPPASPADEALSDPPKRKVWKPKRPTD